MQLILVRHGQTLENQKGIIQGHLPGNLSELGKLQAKEIASKLKDTKIDIIYSSDLKRAKDTTNKISKFHKCKVIFTKELRERYLAELEGRKKGEIASSTTESIKKLEKFSGESKKDSFLRIKKFLKKIISKEDKTILIVGHKGINKAIIAIVKNKSFDYFVNMKSMKNDEIIKLKI